MTSAVTEITSIIDGTAVPGAPGGERDARNPANLDDVVARSRLGDAGTFVAAAARGPRGAARVGDGPGAGARRGDRQRRRGSSRTTRTALARDRHARDRQAVRRGARRGAGGHRHLRLLPRRGPAPLRPDRAERDAGQAAVHVPRAGRRRGDHHCGQLPRRRAVLVPRARAAVRQHRRLEARRVRAGAAPTRWRELFRARRACPTGVLELVLADGAADVDGPRARARARGSSTRSASRARPRSARGSASSAAATCRRRASSSAARTRWS